MRILIGTPAYNGLVTTQYHESVLALVAHNLPVVVDHHPDSLITRGRNAIVAHFLADESYTHLFWIDADVGFTVQQFCRLVDSPHLVTAAAYPFKAHFWEGKPVSQEAELLRYVVNLARPEEPIPEDKLVEVLDAATGFMCIKREAFDILRNFYPELAYTNDVPGGPQEHNWLFFDTMVEDGRYLSEDYGFCRRWQRTGGSIWLDLDSQLSHTGPATFKGNLLLTSALRQNPQPPQAVEDAPKKKLRGDRSRKKSAR